MLIKNGKQCKVTHCWGNYKSAIQLLFFFPLVLQVHGALLYQRQILSNKVSFSLFSLLQLYSFSPFPLLFLHCLHFHLYFIFRKCLIKMYLFYIKKKKYKNYKKREGPMAPTCFSQALHSDFPLSRYMLVIHIDTGQFQLQCLGYV